MEENGSQERKYFVCMCRCWSDTKRIVLEDWEKERSGIGGADGKGVR